MATNLAIDDALIEAAYLAGHHLTQKPLSPALEEYIQHGKLLEILNIFGTIDLDPDYVAVSTPQP